MRLGGEGCSCVLRYSIPTAYSTQSGKDVGDMSKVGGIVSDQPTGRYIYIVPTVFLKSGAQRIRSVSKYSANLIQC